MKRVLLICLAISMGCTEAPTSPPDTSWATVAEIDQLLLYVRDWPDEYVEVVLERNAGESTMIIFRPPRPGVPRILIDSVGPSTETPAEIVELLHTFNVWAMADSNAVGAACSTKTGNWVCNITSNDYSVVIGVTRGGQKRAQRYTRLGESTSNQAARALGDFVLEMVRKRTASAQGQSPLAAIAAQDIRIALPLFVPRHP